MKHFQISRHDVPRETFDKTDTLIEEHRPLLESYLEQLLWWNKRINLVSRSVSRETVWEHIRHSLLLTQFPWYREADYIIDAGTGGGLPGIPLAITSPEKSLLLNDIVSKKIRAVRQMVRKLGLSNVATDDRDIAELSIDTPFLLVTKHAFNIADLWQAVAGNPFKQMVFFKGDSFEDELIAIESDLAVDCFRLGKHADLDFYEDKALVVISTR